MDSDRIVAHLKSVVDDLGYDGSADDWSYLAMDQRDINRMLDIVEQFYNVRFIDQDIATMSTLRHIAAAILRMRRFRRL